VLYVIASERDGFSPSSGFAANGFVAHSPGGYSLVAAVVLTATFLFIVLGATDERAPKGFAAIAIRPRTHLARAAGRGVAVGIAYRMLAEPRPDVRGVSRVVVATSFTVE
jgi:glycerol uptake facilitator-like aquaporin